MINTRVKQRKSTWNKFMKEQNNQKSGDKKKKQERSLWKRLKWLNKRNKNGIHWDQCIL